MRLDIVKVLGVNKQVTQVKVNGKLYSNFLYNILDQVCIWLYYFKYDSIVYFQIDFICLWSWFGYVSSIESKHSMDNYKLIVIILSYFCVPFFCLFFFYSSIWTMSFRNKIIWSYFATVIIIIFLYNIFSSD